MDPLTALLSLKESDKLERGLRFTPAEIAQQPATWQLTRRIFESERSELQAFLRQAHDEHWIVFFVGAGTSDYVGQALTTLFRRKWKCDVSAIASTDLLPNRNDLILEDRDYLWISFSRSGDSPEAVAVIEQALECCPRVRHLVVSCNKDGRMVKLARENSRCYAVVLDDSVNDCGLAMTSSFTNMVISGQELAHLWDRSGFDETLDAMTTAAEYMVKEGAELAKTLANQRHHTACFVGAGSLAAAARESALKLLELSGGQVRTMYETTLGLRHGPMSALNSETLFTCFMSRGETRRRYDVDLLNEVRAKGVVKTVVTVGQTHPKSDYSLYCPAFEQIDDAYRTPVDIIYSQLLGLFASIELGMKPDSPSPAGVISRVVEKFAIYS